MQEDWEDARCMLGEEKEKMTMVVKVLDSLNPVRMIVHTNGVREDMWSGSN